MSLVASISAYGWGQPEGEDKSFSFSEKEKSFSFSEAFDDSQLLPLKAPSHSNLSFPFAQPLKQPSHSHLPLPVGQLTFPNRLLARQNSLKCASYGSIAQPEELLGDLGEWDFASEGANPLSRTGTQKDLSVFSTALLSRMNSKSEFSRQNSGIWNTDVKVERDAVPSQTFALNSPPPKNTQMPSEHVPAMNAFYQVPSMAVKAEPQEQSRQMEEEQDEFKIEEYASETSSSSPTGQQRDGAPNGKPPGTARLRDMGIRRVKQQCYRDLKKSCEIQLTRLVPPSIKNRSKRDFNTLLRDVIAKVRAVHGANGGAAMANPGSRRRGSVVSAAEQSRSAGAQDEAARRHREALLSSEMCGVARVDSENWTIVEANPQLARILHVAPGNHDGVRSESDEIRATTGARLLKGKTLFDIVHPHSTPRLVRACTALMRTVGDQHSPCKTRTVGMLSLQHDARLDCVPKLAAAPHVVDETPPVETCDLELIVCPATPSLGAAFPEARRCTLLLVARPQNPDLPGSADV